MWIVFDNHFLPIVIMGKYFELLIFMPSFMNNYDSECTFQGSHAMSARYICDQIVAKVKPGLLFATIADIKTKEKLDSAVNSATKEDSMDMLWKSCLGKNLIPSVQEGLWFLLLGF